jgi:hypothetical protein
MTRQEALQKLTKILGKDARYQVLREVTSPERREKARAERAAIAVERQELYRQIEAQFGAAKRALEQRESRAFREMGAYRFSAYRRQGSFSLEVAKGDTWEELFADLEARTAAKAAKVGA